MQIRHGGGGFGRNGRRGLGGGYGYDPSGECICPKCHYHEPHQLGTPCQKKICPQCRTPLSRSPQPP